MAYYKQEVINDSLDEPDLTSKSKCLSDDVDVADTALAEDADAALVKDDAVTALTEDDALAVLTITLTLVD